MKWINVSTSNENRFMTQMQNALRTSVCVDTLTSVRLKNEFGLIAQTKSTLRVL